MCGGSELEVAARRLLLQDVKLLSKAFFLSLGSNTISIAASASAVSYGVTVLKFKYQHKQPWPRLYYSTTFSCRVSGKCRDSRAATTSPRRRLHRKSALHNHVLALLRLL